VLNRLRHPDYPKSVCGVVYQGSALRTGCQFSFTCDGSLRRAVDPWLWTQAETVARQALNGYVMPAVGDATYYHADYVHPYWAGALQRITQIGAHIFYRWPGASGDASAFTGQYAGHEADLSTALRTTDSRLAMLRPATSARDLREAVARKRVDGFQVIEASYITSQHRVHSVIPAAAAHTAALSDLVHTSKVTLPPVHPSEVATPTVIATAK
jgi:Cell Wall Hydrolase